MSCIKHIYDRPRPDTTYHAAFVDDASFPSGHATMATVVYLIIGISVVRTQRGNGIRYLAMMVSLLIMISVGISRISLGVHWPSDVLCGWMLGVVWAAGYAFATKRINLSREVTFP